MFVDPEHTAVTYCDADGTLHCVHPTSAQALHADVTYCPLGQDVRHNVVHAVVRPVDVEYVPWAHGVQLNAPSEAEYVPMEHGVQLVAPTIAEEVPMGHKVHAFAPGAEYVPAGHASSTPSDA